MNTRRPARGILLATLFFLLGMATAPTARSADDWPVADCSLVTQDTISWETLTDYITALEVAEVALAGLRPSCRGLLTLEVESTPLTVTGECGVSTFLDGIIEGSIWVDTEPTFNWLGGSNAPALCSVAEATVQTAWLTAETMRAWLDCWTGAYIGSNYLRLDTLQGEVKEAHDDLELIYNIFIEKNLQKFGGSELAALYLPASAGGGLDEVAELVESMADKTEAVGYRLDDEVEEFLTKADARYAAGDYKLALYLYRSAYEKITIRSRVLETRGAP
ncbi:MAG: hypothetical protein ABGY42_04930 [bacterium]